MKNRIFIHVMVLSLLMSSVSGFSAIADSKKDKQNPNKSQTTSLTSDWILPNSKSKSPTLVQQGRTLPIKFTLVESGSLLRDSNMVSLSYVKLNSCDAGAQPIQGTSVVIVSGTPVTSTSVSPSASPSATASSSMSATPSASASPSGLASPSVSSSPSSSDDEKKVVLKNDKGTFQFSWKVPKSLPSGCYKLIAQKGTSSTTVQSPVIRVKAGR